MTDELDKWLDGAPVTCQGERQAVDFDIWLDGAPVVIDSDALIQPVRRRAAVIMVC